MSFVKVALTVVVLALVGLSFNTASASANSELCPWSTLQNKCVDNGCDPEGMCGAKQAGNCWCLYPA